MAAYLLDHRITAVILNGPLNGGAVAVFEQNLSLLNGTGLSQGLRAEYKTAGGPVLPSGALVLSASSSGGGDGTALRVEAVYD